MGLRDLEGCRQGLRCFKSLRSKIKSRIWMDIIRVIIIPSAGLKVEPALRHGLPSLRSLRRAASESPVPRPGQSWIRAVDRNGQMMTCIPVSLSCRSGRTSRASGARHRGLSACSQHLLRVLLPRAVKDQRQSVGRGLPAWATADIF